ncbi:hypothetical protein HDV00_006375 [Rhizophlyctis rosea]|nr:hypothetical protein HDV00_006375 [Rhizophlyctis rosea]
MLTPPASKHTLPFPPANATKPYIKHTLPYPPRKTKKLERRGGADWSGCSTSSQCSGGCCQIAADGKDYCYKNVGHPEWDQCIYGSTGSGGSGFADWSGCSTSSQCAGGCCQVAADGKDYCYKNAGHPEWDQCIGGASGGSGGTTNCPSGQYHPQGSATGKCCAVSSLWALGTGCYCPSGTTWNQASYTCQGVNQPPPPAQPSSTPSGPICGDNNIVHNGKCIDCGVTATAVNGVCQCKDGYEDYDAVEGHPNCIDPTCRTLCISESCLAVQGPGVQNCQCQAATVGCTLKCGGIADKDKCGVDCGALRAFCPVLDGGAFVFPVLEPLAAACTILEVICEFES